MAQRSDGGSAGQDPAMVGTIAYVPLFVQGVIGTSATSSGVVLTPFMLGAVIASAISGQWISKTGHYRPHALADRLHENLMHLYGWLGNQPGSAVEHGEGTVLAASRSRMRFLNTAVRERSDTGELHSLSIKTSVPE